MTLRAVIYGAGSAGNHFAHACRATGFDVVVVDPDAAARERMARDIYPGRYGVWDDGIEVTAAAEGDAALVIVATPPDIHLAVARHALEAHRPRVLALEKPAAAPAVDAVPELDALAARCATRSCRLLVGYNHRVGLGVERAVKLLADGAFGELLALDVEFREHWHGIFAAHPWLSGPADTYLGSSDRGGGASGEHSHGLDLFVYFAACARKGAPVALAVSLDVVEERGCRYDRQCLATVRTTDGLVGRVAQDVITLPPRKRVRAQGTRGALDLSLSAPVDILRWWDDAGGEHEERFEKGRPDDFRLEVEHCRALLEDDDIPSPLSWAAVRDTARLHRALHDADDPLRSEAP